MDMRTNGNNLFFEDNITVDGKDFPQEFNCSITDGGFERGWRFNFNASASAYVKQVLGEDATEEDAIHFGIDYLENLIASLESLKETFEDILD